MSSIQVESASSPIVPVNGDDSMLQCYNISCGQKYSESQNNDEACIYHQEKPYFHDGYKEWPCCKMRSRDFTIFMGFKGCTKGRHSNIPKEEPKQESISTEDSPVKETTLEQLEPIVESFTPPDENLLENIKVVESPNVATAVPPKNIVICKNCKAEESSLEAGAECLYHRGVQVFHDSLKYWSCCPHKKFTEFEEFQKLPPCAKADSHEPMVKIDYKENWFQTGGNLTVALYGLKGARLVEGKTQVTLRGGRKLSARLVNSQGITIFENEWLLHDYVLADGCKTTINPSNVQILLLKVNSKNHWPALVEKKASPESA